MLKTKDFLFPAILFSCLFISLSGWITPVSAQNCNTITSIISTNSISLVCRDQNPTEIIFSHSQISLGNYIYLVTRQNGLLVETFEQNHYDFNELPADHYLVYGAHYQGELTAEPGQFLHQISATVCLTMSTNSYPVQVREMVLKSETLTDYNGFPVSTHDSNDGAVKVKVEKESGGFLYEWNTHPPQFTQTATQLEGGAYLVKVTDSLGCEATLEIILESPDAVRGEFHLVESISCQGAGDGSLEVSATGGVAPYTYSWHHNGQAQAKLDGLAAGVYRATITDANGAEELTNFTLTDPKPLVTEATVFNNDCPGMQNGMIIMAVSGGAAPYVCSWSTGDTGAELVGLPKGEYEVTIIDSNQCVQKERYVVKEADSMIISA
ncbi:MAG: SprB repeat-containing protein, partial [Bacteroidetes bacterium]|nr:SprB repeat-containing protein [Bacteroidota bacterium]